MGSKVEVKPDSWKWFWWSEVRGGIGEGKWVTGVVFVCGFDRRFDRGWTGLR